MDPVKFIEEAALSQRKAINEAMACGDSEIQKFYKKSVVFITGASGFLGKQLVEKLLRSCQISKIYMLLRPKKGKNILERLDAMFKDTAFEALSRQQPNFADKIIAIEGDVADIRLGIKQEDWDTLTEEVNVIFHVAATTKFDETLKLAALINVRGTREALLLGKSCKQLRAYVHVSTAYTHATIPLVGNKVQEIFYSVPVSPETIISMAEDIDTNRLAAITTELIKDWPNTYTFTKSISEELVRTMSDGLPICIVRPGIVLSSYREPAPGWLDISCIYGLSGMVVGGALGVFHTGYVNVDIKLGIVPCDYVNNAIIAAGRETATNQVKGGNSTKIYVVNSTQRNPVTWGIISSTMSSEARHDIPTSKAIYYNYNINTSSKLLYTILTLFLHLIPAYIADLICLLIGKKTRFVKISKKTYKMATTLSYFATNEWQFIDDNLSKLYSGLSKHDQAIFNFDITNINWNEFTLLWFLGVRKYLIKDGLKDQEYAIKKMKYLKIAHYIIMPLYFYSIWKLIFLVFCIGSSLFSALLN